ncbi:MAG: sensor histidine kinase [Acidimicrobiales bacterium]
MADLAAGLGSLSAGCLVLALGGRVRLAALTVLIGVAWFAADWVGWEGGPAAVRSAAMVAAPFLLPLVVHLGLAYPSGRLGGRASVAVVLLAYGTTSIAAAGRAMFRDPFRDLHCWSNCTDNVFLIRPDRDLTRFFDGLDVRVAVSVGVTGAVFSAWRVVTSTPVARRTTWPVLAPASATSLATAAYGLTLLVDPAEDPADAKYVTIFVVRACGVAALAAGCAWTAVRARLIGRAVTRLAVDLGAAPATGTLATTLARSLGDSGLEVAYRMSGTERYVDAAGRPADPRPGRGQATTAIVRGGQPLAVVVHDRALFAEHDLERQIGAAARLAVDNERLRAENLAQLEDLRTSRTSLVATADATRRRLERDLHDGAQQRLLAVLYELRLASSAAAADGGDPALLARLDESSRLAERTLAELRDVAYGIYPAILTEAGLGPALRTLADRAPIAVEIGDVIDSRFPTDVEAAAYLVVADTTDRAWRASATVATVRVESTGTALVVDVKHDGTGMSDDAAVHLADRVGALGGRLSVDRTSVRAELPCAS